tara:strand:- start:780 stop:2573 length:1794 start_codon:yes stop_codon:yes gene_type:complete
MTMNKKRLCCCGTSLPGIRFIEVFPYNAIPSGVTKLDGTISFWIRLAAPTTVSDSTVIFKATGIANKQTATNATADVTFADHEDAILVFGTSSWREIRAVGQTFEGAPADSFKQNKSLNHRGWTWDNASSRLLTDSQMNALTGETRVIWNKPVNSANRALDGTEDITIADANGYLFVSDAYNNSPALSQTLTADDGTSHVYRYYPYVEATQPEQLAYWTSSSIPPLTDRVLVFDFADIFPSTLSITYRVRGTIRDINSGAQNGFDETFSKTYNKTTVSAFGGIPSKSPYRFDQSSFPVPTGDLLTPHGFQGSYGSSTLDSPARARSIQTVYRLPETVEADEHTFTISAAFGSASVIIANIPIYAFRYFYQGYAEIETIPIISPPGYDNGGTFLADPNFGPDGNEGQFLDPSQRRRVGILQSDLNFFPTQGQPPPAGCFSIPPPGGNAGYTNPSGFFARNYKGSEVGDKNIVTSLQYDNLNGVSITTGYAQGNQSAPDVDVPHPFPFPPSNPPLPIVSHLPAIAWGSTTEILNPPSFSLASMGSLTEDTVLDVGVETPGIYCSSEIRQLGQFSRSPSGNQAGLTSVVSCGLIEVVSIS